MLEVDETFTTIRLKVIRGEGQGQEMTSIPSRDYFYPRCLIMHSTKILFGGASMEGADLWLEEGGVPPGHFLELPLLSAYMQTTRDRLAIRYWIDWRSVTRELCIDARSKRVRYKLMIYYYTLCRLRVLRWYNAVQAVRPYGQSAFYTLNANKVSRGDMIWIVEVWNSLPQTTNFATLSAFRQSIMCVDFSAFLKVF